MILANHGHALSVFGRADEAEELLWRAVDVDSDFFRGRHTLGNFLDDRGRFDEAARVLTTAIEWEGARRAGPRSHALAKLLSTPCDYQVRRRDAVSAKKICRRAVEETPENPDNHYNLAMYFMMGGDAESALESLEREVELGDHDWEYLLGDETFSALHEDPRFDAIVQRMKAASQAMSGPLGPSRGHSCPSTPRELLSRIRSILDVRIGAIRCGRS